MTAWTILEARAAGRCKTCSYLVPLAGLRDAIACVSCAATIEIAERALASRVGGLRYPFGAYYDALAEAQLYTDDHDLNDARNSQGTPFQLRRVVEAACHCGVAIARPDPGVADVRCTGCGDAVPVRWPDDGTRQWDPRIWCVVGDAHDRGATSERPLSGTVVPCGKCGAPLAPGKRRAAECTHCGADNFLGDALWTKLYPRPEEHVFYLVYEIDDARRAALFDYLAASENYFFDAEQKAQIAQVARERAAAKLAARVERALAGDGEIDLAIAHALLTKPDADLAALDRLDDRDRAKLVAERDGHRVVNRWAEDRAPAVRAAIAARPDAPPELLAKLRKDPDATVSAAAKANSAYKPGLWARLRGD